MEVAALGGSPGRFRGKSNRRKEPCSARLTLAPPPQSQSSEATHAFPFAERLARLCEAMDRLRLAAEGMQDVVDSISVVLYVDGPHFDGDSAPTDEAFTDANTRARARLYRANNN